VAGKIQQELQQKKPFRHVAEEAALNVLRTSDLVMQAELDLLKPYNLSATQYNVLRILRGAGDEGICCKAIGDRLITRDPDVTRLIDRLEKRGILARTRAKEDRRYVTVHLTKAGMDLVNELDEPIQKLNQKIMRNLNARDLHTLIGLLEQVRRNP
jgi:DNA-binding MarR family transcriptional regulator